MNRYRTYLLTVALLAVCGAGRAQTLNGQALDLDGNPISNLTVQILSAGGVLVDEQFFAKGNYAGITLPATANNQQAVRVIFSSPGRETIVVLLNSRSNHTFNIAMPVRKVCYYRCVPPTVLPQMKPVLLRHCPATFGR